LLSGTVSVACFRVAQGWLKLPGLVSLPNGAGATQNWQDCALAGSGTKTTSAIAMMMINNRIKIFIVPAASTAMKS
jgi:hypothetical protein